MKKLNAISELKTMMTMYYLDAKNAAHNNKKVGWITSGGPVELLLAFDVIPIYPENYAAMCGATKMGGGLAQVAEDHGYSPDLCSYFRIDYGQAEINGGPLMGLPAPDFFVSMNNICGTVIKWYEVMSRKFDKPCYYIDTPFVYGDLDDASLQYVISQFKDMIPFLEEQTGTKFSEEKFMNVLREAERAVKLWGEILEHCAHQPAPMSSFDTFFLMGPIVTLRGTKQCADFYETVLAELKQRVADGVGVIDDEKYRLVWDNIPIWFATKGISQSFAEHNAVFVGATYTTSWAATRPFTDGSDPWEAMAENYMVPYINRGLEKRLEILTEMMEYYHADGIVFHSARSCKAYSLGMYDLKEALLKSIGKPGLIIEGDIADERMFSEAQIQTRIDAFMESLASK
jgi:bcr-type benzoyl-CoA reductase subunit B